MLSENKKEGVAYLRRSSEKQIMNQSFEIQKKEIESCATREGYKIVKWFEDDGVSAFHKKALQRQGMKEIYDYIVTHPNIEGFFFYEETRVSRQFYDFVQYIVKPLREQQPYVNFFSTNQTGPWNENEPITQANLIFAQMESITKSKRAKDARKKCLNPSNGSPYRPGSRPPYGYKYDIKCKMLVPQPEEASIVNFIFFACSWGISNKNIACLLNDANIESPDKTKWYPSTIDIILNNITYLGHYRENASENKAHYINKPTDSLIIHNLHEPIISLVSWELAQQAKELKSRLGKMDTPYFLRGIIKCLQCDRTLVCKDRTPAKYNRKYMNYECTNCKGKVEVASVHKVFLNHLFNDIFSNLQDSMNYAKKNIADWEKRLKKVTCIVKDNIDKLNYNFSFLSKEDPNYEKWEQGFKITQRKLNDELGKLSNYMELIKLYKSNDSLNELFSRFRDLNQQLLCRNEIRILILMFVKEIGIDFQLNNNLYPKFRYFPFVELEKSIVQITEYPQYYLD